jgi:hypothetical protein
MILALRAQLGEQWQHKQGNLFCSHTHAATIVRLRQAGAAFLLAETEVANAGTRD